MLTHNNFVLVEVPEGAYRFTLVTNKELRGRYGRLEWTNRNTGLDGSIKLTQIENYQIVGLAKDLTPDQWCEIFGTEYDAHCFMKQNKLLHETTLIIKKML